MLINHMENPFTETRMSFQDHEKDFNYLIYALNIFFILLLLNAHTRKCTFLKIFHKPHFPI